MVDPHPGRGGFQTRPYDANHRRTRRINVYARRCQEQSSQGDQALKEEPTTAPTTTGESTTSQAVAAAEGFLATLDDAQREQASFDFDDEQKSNWTNVPTADEERNGVPLGDITEEQRQAAMAILEAALSEEGYEKAVGIMEGDEVLAGEGGGGQFGIDHFVVGIFGAPSETGPWMLQFAGHHLVLNLAVVGEDNTLTPSFVGVRARRRNGAPDGRRERQGV